MLRSVLVPDVKQLTDHYLRQQHGGNIVGFRGGRMQRGYGIGVCLKVLLELLLSCSSEVLKQLVKGH